MKVALHHQPNANLSQPNNIVMVRINQKTGQRTEKNTRDTRFEVFRTEYAPQQRTNVREQKELSSPTETDDTNDDSETDTIF